MAHLQGTADEVRARVPAVLEAYRRTRDTVLRSGVAEQRLKERCFAYLASGVDALDLAGLDDRERAALEWAAAIAWDSGRADDALWSRLHALFSEPELVDLGCAIGFELGYQHWRRTIGLSARD
jgi:alkylhydroperoxidase family enzyme